MKAITEYLSSKVKNKNVLDYGIDYDTANISVVKDVPFDRFILVWIGVNVHDDDSLRSAANRHELSTLFVQEDTDLNNIEYAKLLKKHKDYKIDVVVAENPDVPKHSFLNFKLDGLHLQLYSFKDVEKTTKQVEQIK